MASPDEIWLVDFGDPHPGEPAYHRPALVVGPMPIFGSGLPFVFVVPLTTRARGLSLHIAVEANEATHIDTDSYAQCELLRSVNTERLIHRLGTVDLATSAAVSNVIKALLGY